MTAGLYSAEWVRALSARVRALTSGLPGDVGVGWVLTLLRAIAYASSSPALPASARLNAANDPCAVLGLAVCPTAAKPGGRTTGSGIGPAALRLVFAESSRATM